MLRTLTDRRPGAVEQWSQSELDRLLIDARALKRAERTGGTRPQLRGKNLGLMCEAAESPDATLFHRAATELGAQVAHIRPGASDLGSPLVLQHTARMLGKLYDAVECQGLPAQWVEHLDRDAGVPVYDGLAGAAWVASLARQLDGDGDGDAVDNRRYVLQALLLKAVA